MKNKTLEPDITACASMLSTLANCQAGKQEDTLVMFLKIIIERPDYLNLFRRTSSAASVPDTLENAG